MLKINWMKLTSACYSFMYIRSSENSCLLKSWKSGFEQSFLF
jgi:hypothetical protein